MKSPKSKNLKELAILGVPVPYFEVVQIGEQCGPLHPEWLYAVRSAPFVSMAGILDSILNVGAENVPLAIEKIFGSWNNPIAQKYRKMKNMNDEIQMEVIIQRIVSPYNGGIAGIIHTCNPVTGEKGVSGSYVKNKFADELCKGVEVGDDIENLHREHLYLIKEYSARIEKHYQFPQDIEFVIDSSGKFWVVQVRPAQLTDYGFYNWCSWVDGGKEIAAKYADVFDIEKCWELDGGSEMPIAICTGVSGEVLEGEIGKDVAVLNAANIADFPFIFAYDNIILQDGDIHNHFAVEARKAKKNCVIWQNPPKSGEVWIHIQSGKVFTEKPKTKIVNKFKKKYLAN